MSFFRSSKKRKQNDAVTPSRHSQSQRNDTIVTGGKSGHFDNEEEEPMWMSSTPSDHANQLKPLNCTSLNMAIKGVSQESLHRTESTSDTKLGRAPVDVLQNERICSQPLLEDDYAELFLRQFSKFRELHSEDDRTLTGYQASVRKMSFQVAARTGALLENDPLPDIIFRANSLLSRLHTLKLKISLLSPRYQKERADN